jgi:hypothetical protein
MWGPNKKYGYLEKIISQRLVRLNIVQKLFTQNGPKNRFFSIYRQVFGYLSEYLVAEYSAGHYSAEYSADRIVSLSLPRTGEQAD